MTEAKKPRLPNKFEACIPIIVLLGLMMCNYLLDWGQDPHITGIVSSLHRLLCGQVLRTEVQEYAYGRHRFDQPVHGSSFDPDLCRLPGRLFFEWCGTIPALVFYGLKMFTPVIFLPAVCILCAIVGLSLGSAYTVSATLGIAFMTIGETMGISPALIAGAVLSGACTGDKFSPLSDSTNLAAASAQTGLFDHVRAMTMTTFPAFILALLGFTAVAIFGEVGEYDPTMVNQLSDAIEGNFKVMNPVLLLPILVIIVVAVMKLPALPGVLLVSGIGCVFAVVFQGASFSDCITMVHYGYSAETGNELADTLLNRGGMNSMLWTINVALIAIGFGGIYSQIGAVESLLGKFIKRVHTPFQMVLTTILTAMFCIATMCDQYLGLIVPATMYKEKYDDLGLGRNLLSQIHGRRRYPVVADDSLVLLRRLSLQNAGRGYFIIHTILLHQHTESNHLYSHCMVGRQYPIC